MFLDTGTIGPERFDPIRGMLNCPINESVHMYGMILGFQSQESMGQWVPSTIIDIKWIISIPID
jgi:hypothetical protein